MAKKKCKKCGAECCKCTGCRPETYVDGICPLCQKTNNAISSNNQLPELQQSQRIVTISGLQPQKSATQ